LEAVKDSLPEPTALIPAEVFFVMPHPTTGYFLLEGSSRDLSLVKV